MKEVPTLRHTRARCDVQAKEGGFGHPDVVLAKKEADEYNGAQYWSSMTLDAHHYSKAVAMLDDENECMDKVREQALERHITEMRRFQDMMQMSDFSF